MESDAREQAAQAKKLTVRERVDNLRKRFTALLDENAKLPQPERLPREAFYVDPGLHEFISKETEARLEEKKLEMAYDTEKINLSRSKLESAFLDGLAVEHIALSGFANGLQVRSFRTTDVAPWLKEATDHVHSLIDKEQKLRQRDSTGAVEGGGFGGGEGDAAEEGGAPGEAELAAVTGADGKISKMQERLLRRRSAPRSGPNSTLRSPTTSTRTPSTWRPSNTPRRTWATSRSRRTATTSCPRPSESMRRRSGGRSCYWTSRSRRCAWPSTSASSR